jgi:hypothetical protein
MFTVARFAADLVEHGGDPDKVTDTSSDMSTAFISGISQYLPNARMTFDRYHLAVTKPRCNAASIGSVTTLGNRNRRLSTGPGTSALVLHPVPTHRARAALRARCTRSRTTAVLSGSAAARSIPFTGRIATRRSTRSNSGPDSRPRYRRRADGAQVQSRSSGGAHGHGFAASTS